MKTINIGKLILPILILGTTLACTLPFSPTPTPFVFPTVDATKTALYAFATQLAEASLVPTQEPPTQVPPTAIVIPTIKPQATNTTVPTRTPIAPTPVPPTKRSGPVTYAQYVKNQPELDGGWGDWSADQYPADWVVYGYSNWKSEDDLSASYMVEWDEDYLYVAWKVYDDKYVQKETGADLYQGDSVEILLDTWVQADYWNNWLNTDDYQVGISPGKTTLGNSPEAYLWFPSGETGKIKKAIIGVKSMTGGYRVTVGIPWTVFGIDPYNGLHLGFAASVSDDDSKTGSNQQTMVSSTKYRVLGDPTTWGDLVLVK